MSNQDEGSLQGQGSSVMLPSRGNPFPVEAQGTEGTEGLSGGEPGALPDPHDLSPDDLAAMFPSSQDEREAPVGDATASPSIGASAMTAESEAQPSSMADASASMSAEDLAAQFPTSAEARGADMGAASAEPPPGARMMPDVPTIAPGMNIPSTTVVGGQALPGMRAFGGGGLQISENVGISAEAYQPGQALPGQGDLVKLLVPDSLLTNLWLEIDTLKDDVSSLRGISRAGAREILARLTAARNYLLNDRANFEEADREASEARYLLERIKRSGWSQQSRAILAYLLGFLVVIVLGAMITNRLAETIGPLLKGPLFGAPFDQVWSTMLWGGIGGLTGSMYGLWVHVARDQDYDPQYAMWYYTNPLLGLIFGLFVYIVMRATVLPVLSGGQDLQTPLYIIYIFAWAVGFQQNLALSLANSVLKKLIPEEEKGQPAPSAGSEK
jgi:hypothetical protein